MKSMFLRNAVKPTLSDHQLLVGGTNSNWDEEQTVLPDLVRQTSNHAQKKRHTVQTRPKRRPKWKSFHLCAFRGIIVFLLNGISYAARIVIFHLQSQNLDLCYWHNVTKIVSAQLIRTTFLMPRLCMKLNNDSRSLARCASSVSREMEKKKKAPSPVRRNSRGKCENCLYGWYRIFLDCRGYRIDTENDP